MIWWREDVNAHATNEGRTVLEVTGYEYETPEYSRHMTTLRKLMDGSPSRGYDGMNLFRSDKRIKVIGRPIWLTRKGRIFAKKLGVF